MFTDTLGDWLELQRRRSDFWKKLFFIALIVLVLGNVFVTPKPHDQAVHPAGHVEEESQLEDQAHGPAVVEHGEEQAGAHEAVESHGDAGGHGGGHEAAGGHAQGFFDVDAPHFVFDKWPGFWPVFALFSAVAMIFVLKKIVAKVLGRREDFYVD